MLLVLTYILRVLLCWTCITNSISFVKFWYALLEVGLFFFFFFIYHLRNHLALAVQGKAPVNNLFTQAIIYIPKRNFIKHGYVKLEEKIHSNKQKTYNLIN